MTLRLAVPHIAGMAGSLLQFFSTTAAFSRCY
jgi:hypothetical protein